MKKRSRVFGMKCSHLMKRGTSGGEKIELSQTLLSPVAYSNISSYSRSCGGIVKPSLPLWIKSADCLYPCERSFSSISSFSFTLKWAISKRIRVGLGNGKFSRASIFPSFPSTSRTRISTPEEGIWSFNLLQRELMVTISTATPSPYPSVWFLSATIDPIDAVSPLPLIFAYPDLSDTPWFNVTTLLRASISA